MQIIKKCRKQKGIYWKFKTKDKTSKYIYELPVEMDCRWEEMATQAIDAEGKETTFTSKVYVDREMKAGDVIMLGDINTDLAGPDPPSQAKRIRKMEHIPTMNAKQFVYLAYL